MLIALRITLLTCAQHSYDSLAGGRLVVIHFYVSNQPPKLGLYGLLARPLLSGSKSRPLLSLAHIDSFIIAKLGGSRAASDACKKITSSSSQCGEELTLSLDRLNTTDRVT